MYRCFFIICMFFLIYTLYRLTKGRDKARLKKLHQIAKLLDLPTHLQPCPSPPTHTLGAMRQEAQSNYKILKNIFHFFLIIFFHFNHGTGRNKSIFLRILLLKERYIYTWFWETFLINALFRRSSMRIFYNMALL